jgi:hypothetical protein
MAITPKPWRKKMSQNNQILKHLKKKPLTPLDALAMFGCFRLAARIQELRVDGHRIRTDMENKNGKKYAKYSLIKGN